MIRGEGVLQQGHRQALVVQRGVNARAQELQRLQLGELFILGVDDVPGGAGGVGVLQVPVEVVQGLVVVLVLPQVPLAHRQEVSLLESSPSMRSFCSFWLMWKKNFSTRYPLSVRDRSNRLMLSTRWA